MKQYLIAKFGLVIVLILSSCATQSQTSLKLELLGQDVIPYNHSFKDTPIGGLSGLTYESATQTYYVISDDRSEFAGARYYSFNLKLNEKQQLTDGSIVFEDVFYLSNASGHNYASGKVDPEGIAVHYDSLMYVSSEGIPKFDIPPFVNVFGMNGTFDRSFTIPDAYWRAKGDSGAQRGVRTNFGFEGLAITPDRSRLYAGTENALMQDGPVADSTSSSPSRIIVYELPSGNILHEYCYTVSPVHIEPGERGDFAVNGLTDIVALDNAGHLLSIDRNYVARQGTHIKLYEILTEGATDIKGIPAMQKSDKPITPVQKKLVANLGDFDVTLDNFEGLVLGPELPGGGRLLLMVSDNNFAQIQQTIFTAFRLTTE